MNNEKDLVINSSQLDSTTPTNVVPISRAKSFQIRASQTNYDQIATTIKAYAVAGMPFEHIANAGEEIGEVVERGEIDASIKDGWQDKKGEIAEDRGKILAWQSRGERISVIAQISSPLNNKDLAPYTENSVTNLYTQPQTIDVIEGISAVTTNQPSLSDKTTPSNITDISQSPYLTAPAILKKAA